MEWNSIQPSSSTEMREKARPLSFLGRRSQVPRPLSEATIFDTDHEDSSDYSSPRSLESLDNGSQTTISTPDSVQTPNSGVIGAFEFHFDEKPIKGPNGPHLFRASPDIVHEVSDLEVEVIAQMSPVVGRSVRVEMTAPIMVERPQSPSTRPFSSLNRAVAELDETQVRDWTPRQVADWMREAGFEHTLVAKFIRHDISGAVLLDLQAEDLKELDINSFGKRRKVMSSIEYLRNSSMIPNEASLSRSNSRLEGPPRTLQRTPRPEEAHVLAFRTETGLKSRSSSAQRRGRRQYHNDGDDHITPAESVSIVAIEQLLPKLHKCSKGEDCLKWQKQQRKLLRLKAEFADAPRHMYAAEVQLEEIRPTSRRRKSDAEPTPSVVASSDVLGPQLERCRLTPELLSEVQPRDPQESVRQFLSFQHLQAMSASVDPSPPPAASASFVPPPSRTSPAPLAQHLRSLPKLTIPFDGAEQISSSVDGTLTQPSEIPKQLMAQLQKDPYHYGGVASPADIYRVGTPFSATDIPVTSYAMEPLARDASQSVPPDMRYGASTMMANDPIHRPSSTQPRSQILSSVTLNRSGSSSRRHPRRSSFAPSVAPLTEDKPITPRSMKSNLTIDTSHAQPARLSSRLPTESLTSNSQHSSHLPTRVEDISHSGWMRKRKTSRLLRHEWTDHHFRLRGTELTMHATLPASYDIDQIEAETLERIDVDEYAIACQSLASSSKLSAAFKKSILGSSYRQPVNEQAFAFSLIPEKAKDVEKAKKLFAVGGNKSHHFAVKSRDERIEWMRDLMLAKALKKAEASKINIISHVGHENMI